MDVRAFHNARVPSPRFRLAWRLPMVESHYTRFDWPYFERLLQGCRHIASKAVPRGRPFLAVYDCGPLARS